MIRPTAAARRCGWLLVCVTCVARPLHAQLGTAAENVLIGANEPAAAAKVGKTLHALHITTEPPILDGELGDEVWLRAPKAGGFVQWDPDNGEPASERTEMQVVYDNRYVYVAVHCYDRTPSAIARGLGRRDDTLPTDNVGLAFDPRHDHQTGYIFNVNASGVQGDTYAYDDDHFDRDFDAVWEVRTANTSDGWTAEFRIPFSQMRFTSSPDPGRVWGFSARRNIRRRAETAEWTARPRGEKGEVSRWGHLIFDEGLAVPRRLELQPYALLGAASEAAESPADVTKSAGLDLRLGLGSAATFSATVNPDFAQVEQDPAVLNLTVFETFFPEKRPFFLEDSRTFVPPYGLFQLFHSRRIGRAPDRFEIPGDEEVVKRPSQTTVVGAAKLTGKGSGWTYGALTALTSRQYARVASGRDILVEPRASYNVARVQRTLGAGSSNIGAIVTSVIHEQEPDAFTGGFDYNFRWDRNRTIWNGQWVFTHAPDVGGTATSGGGLTNFNFSRKHYGVAGHLDHLGRDFRVNDAGFLRTRANRTQVDGNAWIEQPDPWKAFRRMSVGFFGARGWNDDRLVFLEYLGVYGSTQFLSYWTIDTEAGRNAQVFDDLDTRGGPPILVPARPFLNVFVNSDSRKSWKFSLGMNAEKDAEGGWSARFGPGLTLQPSTRLQASISTSYTVAKNIAQWIANTDVTGDAVDDHVYGTLRRNVVDVTLRSTYAIHRDLTLQLFVQPFVAVGGYSNIRRLARPMSFDFEPTALSYNPDFNNKSLRSNVVLRWEYLRGSTLYVVWNGSIADDSRPGVFSATRDFAGAFSGDGPRALMVKVSYWLGR